MENNLQHVQVPNDLVQTKGLTPIDALVYVSLRSFDNGKECFPSLKTIADRAGVSIKIVQKALKQLEATHWIKSSCQGRGHYTYYTFLKDNPFEPFSYEFLNNKDLSPLTKGYLICSQHNMFKNSETEGALSMTASDLAASIDMPLRTVYRCEQELKEKGILQIEKSKGKDMYGFKKEVRLYDFSKYFQAIAYILRHQQDQLNEHEKQIIMLRENTAHQQSFEKDVVKAISVLSQQIAELKKQTNHNNN